MPRHDYFCPSCKVYLRDQYRSITVGGQGDLPSCQHCGYPMIWVVPRLRMDLRTDGEGKSGEAFQKFTIRDGLNRVVEIDSLSKARQVERESEKMAADGIGQPIRFRAFAQDHSNMQRNTFGDGPAEKPTDAAKARFGFRGGASQLQRDADGNDPECPYGPGVDESNASALPDV